MEIGLKTSQNFSVKEEDTADQVGSGQLRVLATPVLLSWLEKVCWQTVASALEEGETTVGSHADFMHLAPSKVGAQVLCQAELIEVDRKRLVFSVQAHDGDLLVAEGILERFVVKTDRFLEKLAQREN